ncbi:vacuolar protein sorting 53 [Lycorma delicatula]|uniref:vacuolar protein sorting 53 n=1 Tax=Lycorma delicatula TaxID=130591 RepID=UPI003F50F43B
MTSSVNGNEEEDFLEDKSYEIINFPPEVQSAIDQVIPSTDPLSLPDFNAIDYINSLFPTEQSLSNIDDVISKMECKIRDIDDQIRTVVRGQTNVGQDGRSALEDAQRVIRQLFLQISEIKAKAERSEETVREITQDIKQLDCAKRNLTSAITTLNHLHMLVGGVDSLKMLTKKRQYGEIVMPLQAITEVMKHFDSYLDIPQIKQLADEVSDIQVALATQITSDFHEAFTGPQSKNFVPNRQLAEACHVVSILDPKVKKDLLKWFVNLQLNEYSHLFHESEDIAWLDKLDMRYTWFKKHLLQCEDKFGAMFPSHWDVSERITVEFCHMTRQELTKIMAKRKNEIDVKLLLFAIQRTAALENLLAQRFSGVTLLEDSSSKYAISKQAVKQKEDYDESLNPFNEELKDTVKTENKQPLSPFHNIIGECFLPYLYIYIESLDNNLYELMERFISDAKNDFGQSVNQEAAGVVTISRAVQGVLPSCADLFVFYKKCLVQCTQLSNGQPMLGLATVFQKYLREYALNVLQNNLPKVSGSTTSFPASVSNITRDFRDRVDLSAAAGIIQTFLKEGDNTRFTKQEQARICCILTTAEYCLETTRQLEEKLKEKVDPSLTDKINLSQEQDIFHNVISNCIQLLVQDLEIACEPALTTMIRMQWQNVESVGDQSSYVTAITAHLKSTVPLIRDNLSSSRKYFTQFCVKFANSFIPKFIQNVYKCKPISTVGAEQLLLDTHMLKTILLDLPSIGSSVNRKAPASYTKVVVKGMTRCEMILKVVMAPTEPDTSFVDQFLKLLPESDIQEFQKVLEMKGLKTADRNHLINMFRPRHSSGFVSSTAATAVSPKHDTSSIRKLNNLIRKNY